MASFTATAQDGAGLGGMNPAPDASFAGPYDTLFDINGNLIQVPGEFDQVFYEAAPKSGLLDLDPQLLAGQENQAVQTQNGFVTDVSTSSDVPLDLSLDGDSLNAPFPASDPAADAFVALASDAGLTIGRPEHINLDSQQSLSAFLEAEHLRSSNNAATYHSQWLAGDTSLDWFMDEYWADVHLRAQTNAPKPFPN